ncbi:protein CLP1 homolog [Oryza brachyantha]|nr:protein CLP1 homolog [Oryza brachyantha]
MAAAGGAAQPPRQYKLAPQSELRVEVPPDAPVRVRLVAGTAEVFGTELPPEGWVPVPPRSKIAIFTWHGATVELDGASESEYSSDETPMVIYVNTHAILDARRARARAAAAQGAPLEASQGPRVIIVGPSDSGKSTLCKMLLSWAAKQGWKPTYVDLDIGQGSITIPGCISATPIEKPIDIVDGIPLEMPLAYFYGHPSPSVSPDVYRALMKELAQTLDKQFSGNSESRAAGMIINTMGWVENLGLELLHNSIEIFKANVILVLGQEKLWKILKDATKNKPGIDVVKLHKSEGVVPRNPKYRQKTRSFRIKEYFYGIANDLAPHSNVVNFSDVSVYKIGSHQAPKSALPIGAEPVADPTRLIAVNISTDMVHTVLAVSYAKEPDEIISSNVAGFIHVTDVDIQRKKLTYIAPCPGDLPSKLLIASSLTWYEA